MGKDYIITWHGASLADFKVSRAELFGQQKYKEKTMKKTIELSESALRRLANYSCSAEACEAARGALEPAYMTAYSQMREDSRQNLDDLRVAYRSCSRGYLRSLVMTKIREGVKFQYGSLGVEYLEACD